MSSPRRFPLEDDTVTVLVQAGRLPTWHDVPADARERIEQEHVDRMLAVGREHGLRRIEGFHLITAQGAWQRFWVIDLPDLAAAEAWIEAETAPPYGAHGYYASHLARPHAVAELADWPSRARPTVVPDPDPGRLRPLAAATDSIVILLFGRWRPEAELTDAEARGDTEHVTLMRRVAREHGLMRIESWQLIAPRDDWHRAWVIEFPTLEGAEAWLAAEVLPPHGRFSDKRYLLARRWDPAYFGGWTI